MTSRRQHLPWTSHEIKRNTIWRHKMYKATRSGKTEHKEAYNACKIKCQKNICTATLLPTSSLKTTRATTNTPSGSTSKRNARKSSFGIPPLKQDSTLFKDNETKANILLREIKSVFTKESPTPLLPDMTGPKTARIAPLTIWPKGVEKFLRGLKPEKPWLWKHPKQGSQGIVSRALASRHSFVYMYLRHRDCAQRLDWCSHFPHIQER